MVEDVSIIQRESKFVFSYMIAHKSPKMIKFVSKLFGPDNKYRDLSYCKCGRDLDIGYVYLIHRLDKTGLLPKDYKVMCCYCNLLACIGFIIPDEWFGNDVGMREINFVNNKTTIIIRIKGLDTRGRKLFDVDIKIHNIEKVLETGRIINDVNM